MTGLVAIPAYNEQLVIRGVIDRISSRVLGKNVDVLVIDDGSTDGTVEIVKKTRAIVLSHPINRGLGAALGTAFEFARRKNYDFLVTLDGDGQHDPAEIESLVKPILSGQADFVVGSRVFKKGMPKSRRILTLMASLATLIFVGVWTTDSQSGFRAFSKKAIENIFIEVDRMEISSDFFNQARLKRLRIKEIPIKPIYTDYSLKKGQNFFNSFNIISRLAFKKLIR